MFAEYDDVMTWFYMLCMSMRELRFFLQCTSMMLFVGNQLFCNLSQWFLKFLSKQSMGTIASAKARLDRRFKNHRLGGPLMQKVLSRYMMLLILDMHVSKVRL